MRKWFVIGGAAVVALVLAAVFLLRGPDMAQYDFLLSPRITVLPEQRVLEVEFEGTLEMVMKDAFMQAFKTYYRMKGVPKGPKQPAPRARFVIPADVPKDRGERTAYFEKASLRGAVAIPVPAGTASLPDFKAGGKMPARLATWSYGEVAEILHIGPYDKELPAIDKLEQFIKDQGYMIVGEHEEEYLRGPGMPFSKPEKYYTIIRFRVKKAETP